MANQADVLINRYASKDMVQIFSDDNKYQIWRRLWLSLAKGEQKLGLNISDEQIKQLEDNLFNIDYKLVSEYEFKLRHDVMAHVHAYGDVAPLAKGIIHLGATSCYLTDNGDIIIYKEALELLKNRLLKVIANLTDFSIKYKSLPTLGFTHMQPAQLTTVGKRATLWINELLIDLENLNFVINSLPLRGVKGTTGTQASFMELFNQDGSKVDKLNELVLKDFNFKDCERVTGQTYSRKRDYNILSVLSQISQSSSKFANDIRILQSIKEIEEPFEKSQIGSSAMAYKRNPMRSERIASLSRYVISLPINAAITASSQWFERTLDDSANKRIVMSNAFLALDSILCLYENVSSNLVVNEKVIQKHVLEELPFMSTEVILMECVKKGGDRQVLHEEIRKLSMQAAKNVKQNGKENNLIDLIKLNENFSIIHDIIDEILDPYSFIGRSEEQVEKFINDEIENKGILKNIKNDLKSSIRV